MRDLICEVSYC